MSSPARAATRTLLVALLVVAVGVDVADAQPAPPSPARSPGPGGGGVKAPRIVAIAPLATLGTEDTSAASKKLTQQLETAVSALRDTKVITAAQVADAIKRSKKSQLRVCEREPACLAELGKLVGAQIVVDGEVGGLGEARIVYLGATDVATGKEIRSTTWSVGEAADPSGGAAGAASRLLDPDAYRGQLRFAIDVKNATVYVNGSKTALSSTQAIELPVGTQAIRVTHPEYRDFVRFIDVPYGRPLEVKVGMQQYPIVKHDIQGRPIQTDRVVVVEPPWYRRWYVITGGAVGVAIVSAIVVGALVHDFPDGQCRKVDGEGC